MSVLDCLSPDPARRKYGGEGPVGTADAEILHVVRVSGAIERVLEIHVLAEHSQANVAVLSRPGVGGPTRRTGVSIAKIRLLKRIASAHNNDAPEKDQGQRDNAVTRRVRPIRQDERPDSEDHHSGDKTDHEVGTADRNFKAL